MDQRVRALAPAKVNLHLEVYPPREDGYHPILSLFQSISWFDELEFCSLTEVSVCEIEGNLTIPPEENLIWKAAKAFKEATGIRKGLKVRLQKRIPMGAGLGGGSSDAASTLRGINRLFGSPLSEEELSRIGAALGSDVPFFFKGSTAIVRGRGEQVFPIQGRTDYRLVVVVPPFHVSTREAFRWLDQEGLWTEKTGSLEDAGLEKELAKPIREWRFHNAFEKVLEKRYPVYGELRRIFRDTGASYCAVSGSGSSMFGVYLSESEAGKAELVLKQHFPMVQIAIPLDRMPNPILE